MIDFTVDVFGLANRRSGAYNLVRAAGLGYFWGNSNARDGAASTCQYLQNDVQVGGRWQTCNTQMGQSVTFTTSSLISVVCPFI